MIGIIIGGGTIRKNFDKDFFKEKTIICADRGYDYALENNISPTYILGDFDSISDKGKKALERNNSENIKVYPVKKNKGDMELAIDLAISEGIKKLYIIGALGSRMDHTLTNILSLKMFYKKGIEITILGENNEIVYTEKDTEIKNNDYYKYISFIPIEETEISLEGFEYKLNHQSLEVGSSLQVSNRFLENKGKLILHSGGVFIIRSRD